MIISIDQYTYQLSFEELLFVVDGDQHNEPQLTQVQGIRAYRMFSPKRNMHSTPSYPTQSSETIGEDGMEILW